jgi:hypothetical protein
MRQVFSSPRLENVEGIAKFLEEHGIEVRITQGRSYKGGWSGRRSYRDAEGPQPAVWVIKSEDQPKARQLLREAGLLGSTRASTDSYLAPSVHEAAEPRAVTPQRRAFRYKIGLLVAIGIAVALAYSVMRKPRAPQSPTAPAASSPSAPAAAPVYRIDTPPALAETLAAAEFDAHAVKAACIAIDGKPAPDDVAARLTRPGLAVTPCAPASPGPLVIEVGNYLTDGSGEGTVELAVSSPDASGRPTTQIRTLQVRRVESDWHVLRVLSVR